MQIDGATGVAFQAGIEQFGRVFQRRAFGKGQLDLGLVGLAGAEDAIVRPDRNAPLPLLDHRRVGLLEERADMGERLAAPIVQGLDLFINQFGRRFGFRAVLRLALGFPHEDSSSCLHRC